MFELSNAAQGALILHDAKKTVAGRCDGAWWVIDKLEWQLIGSLRGGPEHSFVLGLIHSYNERHNAA